MDWTVVAILVSVVVALDCLAQLLSIRLALPIFEQTPPLKAPLFPPDPSAEAFDVRTPDGLTLRGCFWRPLHGAPRGVVLFCHEYGSDRWSALSYLAALRHAGCIVAAFDFRNQGSSDELPGYRPLHWVSRHEVRDVAAVIAFLQQHPELRSLPLALHGVSRGGCAALGAAPHPAVRGVVTDGAFSTLAMTEFYIQRWSRFYIPEWLVRAIPLWHIRLTARLVMQASQVRRGCVFARIERALPRLRRKPVLMISGTADNYVIPEMTTELQALTRQPPANGLWLVPGAKHNGCRVAAQETYDRRLVEFYAAAGVALPDLVRAVS